MNFPIIDQKVHEAMILASSSGQRQRAGAHAGPFQPPRVLRPPSPLVAGLIAMVSAGCSGGRTDGIHERSASSSIVRPDLASTVVTLNIRRIDCGRDDATAAIADLRRELSPQGNVVSPEGRARTIAAFGEPLSPTQVVEKICAEVAATRAGRRARFHPPARRRRARSGVGPRLRERAGRRLPGRRSRLPARRSQDVRENILAYQRAILHRDVRTEPAAGIALGLRYTPLRRVGVCIPGGAAAYPSTLLMTVVPAQAAGVREIAVVVPPTRFGGYNADLLAACRALGVTEVHRIGGAQAVAALAYGVEGIPAVDKIVGPGNLFVALAKKHVYGEVDIDSIAGPSEVVLIADETANPEYHRRRPDQPGRTFAGGEHPLDLGALPDRPGGRRPWKSSLRQLSRGDLARDSLERFGALILVRDEAEAVRLSNLFAPEHLHVSTADPERLLPSLTNAGAIFLGHHTPVAVGDYAAGPSHVLPTGGTARWASGPLGQRLPEAVEPDLGHARGAGPAGPRRPPARRHRGAHRPPIQRRRSLDDTPSPPRIEDAMADLESAGDYPRAASRQTARPSTEAEPGRTRPIRPGDAPPPDPPPVPGDRPSSSASSLAVGLVAVPLAKQLIDPVVA